MAQIPTLKARGLYTSPNALSEIPQGALSIADDAVIDRPGVIEQRRGHDRLRNPFVAPAIGAEYTFGAGTTDHAAKLFIFQKRMFAHLNTGALVRLLDLPSVGFTSYTGNYYNPNDDDARCRFQEASKNLYFTTSTGVQVLDSLTGTPRAAGVPEALDFNLAISVTASWLADKYQCAYRVAWAIKDANGRVVTGAPSGRLTISNTVAGAARSVDVQNILVPAGITTSHFLRIYRTKQTKKTPTDIDPGEEMGVVYEYVPTAADITAGIIASISDITDDGGIGEPAYFSAEGLLQENSTPPWARDIAYFKGSLFFAGTRQRHFLLSTMVNPTFATPVTITIAGNALVMGGTAAVHVDTTDGTFNAYASGTPGANIAETARRLVRTLNRMATNTTVYGFYISGSGDNPGQMVFVRRDFTDTSFAMTISANGNNFYPVVPTAGTTLSSLAESVPGRYYFSKQKQEEHVPYENFDDINDENAAILRMMPLKETLYFFKEDGLFKVTGSGPDTFVWSEVDTTIHLYGPETVVKVANKIFALTNQGVVAITDAGVEVVSLQIERDLQKLFGDHLSHLKKKAHAVSYETDRKYILWVPTTGSVETANRAYVYNVFTESWTTWGLTKTSAMVHPTEDVLYFGEPSINNLSKELKTFTPEDYWDTGDTYITTGGTIYPAAGGMTFNITTEHSIEVGDSIWMSDYQVFTVSGVSKYAITVEEKQVGGMGIGVPFVVRKAIPFKVRWPIQDAERPGMVKQFQEAYPILEDGQVNVVTLAYANELVPRQKLFTKRGNTIQTFGTFEWGVEPWGGFGVPLALREEVPQEYQTCSQLLVEVQHKRAREKIAIIGLMVTFAPGSPAVRGKGP